MLNIAITVMANVIPLALAVILGFLLGKNLQAKAVHLAGQSITPIVWVVLWVIGVSVGETFQSFDQGLSTFNTALVYSLCLSAMVFLFLMPLSRAAKQKGGGHFWHNLIHPLKECVLAFGLVGLGAYCYTFGWQDDALFAWLFNIKLWLYLLLFFIGVELTLTSISRSWLSWAVLRVPLLVILASLVAGAMLSVVLDEKLCVALALSSGFGWFSLSGALASQYLGESYGAIALLNDLMRELLGIVMVFVLGSRFPEASIGVCGATSADTTLPFIRKACDTHHIPVALMSGLVLTLVAPFMMLFFMSFV